MRPSSGTSMAPTRWSSVDLPEPEGPTRAVRLPSAMSTLTSSAAFSSEPSPSRYRFDTCSKRTSPCTGPPEIVSIESTPPQQKPGQVPTHPVWTFLLERLHPAPHVTLDQSGSPWMRHGPYQLFESTPPDGVV